MKKLFAVPVAALVAVGLIACSESPTESFVPQFELVDEDLRVAAGEVNAHVYGSFSITFEGSPGALGNGVDANFPGKPKAGPGSCGLTDGTDTGVWYNPQGKRTSGSASRPHPHCVGSGSATVAVILEPISTENGNIGSENEFLRFSARDGAGGGFNYDGVRIQGSGGRNTNAKGIIEAYAIDATTINDPNGPKRVGILTIDLAQLQIDGTNLFQTECLMGDATLGPRCLNKVIEADYEPWGPDAVGHSIKTSEMDEDDEARITGFLYWSPADAPFNYGDDEGDD